MALSNSIKDNLASIICFSVVLLFALWSNPHLNGYFEIDTQSYIMVAHNFLCSWSQDRPIGYPLFLRLCMLISDAYWVPMVIIIQFIILSSMACILLRLFLDYNIALFIALPTAIIIGICPNLINPASDILPELMFGWFILLAWYQVNHINVSGGGRVNPVLNYLFKPL